ncbi:MAG: hypothetical protein ACP5H8_02065 [Candidatus Micrarchaeia archaeon]
MAKLSEWRPRIADYEPSISQPRIPLCNGARNVQNNNAQWGRYLKDEKRIDLTFYEQITYKRYKDKEWYNRVLKNGWPGVKGEVRLGRPVINEWGEVIVIILNEKNYPKVEVLKA